jgi:hypothetical protein
MRVNVDVLKSWWLNRIKISLLILNLLVEHLMFLLVFLDAQFNAMHEYFVVDDLL